MATVKYISYSAPPKVIETVKALGYDVTLVDPIDCIETSIASHPDIRMCRLGYHDSDTLVTAENNEIGSEYPYDVAFNAACTGKYFIHNLKYTNKRLLEAAEQSGMVMLDVKQGYSKCSVIIIDEDSIITYDKGIAAVCSKVGMDVLLVEPGHVYLEGFDTGFIGGTSGRLGDTILICGDISQHPNGKQIIGFIEGKGLACKSLDMPLTDIGSII